jgi:hypothetical protein
VSGLALPGSASLPLDEGEGTVCPVRSGAAPLVRQDGSLVKAGVDVPCRKTCAWFLGLEPNGRPRCAVAVLAQTLMERA